jgi:hypothetical protein
MNWTYRILISPGKRKKLKYMHVAIRYDQLITVLLHVVMHDVSAYFTYQVNE